MQQGAFMKRFGSASVIFQMVMCFFTEISMCIQREVGFLTWNRAGRIQQTQPPRNVIYTHIQVCLHVKWSLAEVGGFETSPYFDMSVKKKRKMQLHYLLEMIPSIKKKTCETIPHI